MSQTRAVERVRIWELLGDMNPEERVVSLFRVHEVMDRNINIMLARTTQNTSSSSSVSVVSGTSDYSVDGSVSEVDNVAQVFDSTNNRELLPLSFTEFNTRYLPDVGSPVTGLPIHYTLYEASGQAIKIRLGPRPTSSLTLKLYRTAPQNNVLPTSEGSTIPFSDALMRGFEAACAADIIGMLDDVSLGRLHLSPNASGMFRQQAEQAIREHNIKESRLGRRQTHVMRVA